jgi:hypothetical protein
VPAFSNIPSFFDVVKQQNPSLSTAVFDSGWGGIIDLLGSNHSRYVDTMLYFDADVTASTAASNFIIQKQPNLLFLYLSNPGMYFLNPHRIILICYIYDLFY